MNKKAILEGLLFVEGEEGLSFELAEKILEVTKEELANLIVELEKDYESEERGIHIELLGNRLKLTTKKEHHEYYQMLVENEETETLSEAALETLAIIAYNEPVTRIKIDEIRGLNSSHMVRKLVARNLIKEVGRSELPGRPILYGVTDDFLDYFGLFNKEDLPKIEEKEEKKEEKDLFHSKYQEEMIDIKETNVI